MQTISDLFQECIDDNVKVWAEIKDRRSNESYYQFLITGEYQKSGESSSNPLKKKGKVVANLRKSFRNHKCVIITGPNKPGWTKALGESGAQSALIGAVMMYSWDNERIWNKEASKKQHAWILIVSANKEGVFSDHHIQLMRVCNDILSSVLNVVVRDV